MAADEVEGEVDSEVDDVMDEAVESDEADVTGIDAARGIGEVVEVVLVEVEGAVEVAGAVEAAGESVTEPTDDSV